MSQLVNALVGEYTTQYLIRLASLLEITFYCFLFAGLFKRRKNFCFRLLLSVAPILFLIYPLAILRSEVPGAMVASAASYIQYGYTFLILFLLYREPLSELLLCLCAGVATQSVVGSVYEIIMELIGKNPYMGIEFIRGQGQVFEIANWGIYFAIHIAIALALAFVFRRPEIYAHDSSTTRRIVVISMVIIAVTVPLGAISAPIKGERAAVDTVLRIFAILYGVLILSLRRGILEQSRMKQELQVMERLFHAEKKQLDSIRGEMDVINIKCHDIRQQLSKLEGKLTEQELEALKAAVQFYDLNIKTGNEIVDAILYKKQLYCEKNKIRLSCMADGVCVSFLKPTHLYSLLSNALENALEAVETLEDAEKRVVSISIRKEEGASAIHVTNYFNGTCSFRDGIPVTHKAEQTEHGFGIKSMQYVAELYEGNVSFETERDIFYLHILLPNIGKRE